MTCPDLYIGATRATSPPSPFYLNPAIVPPATFTVGTLTTINVFLRNAGTDDSPLTRLELFWSDPTTGFMAVMANRIGFNDFTTVPGHVAFPAADGEVSYSFAWTPPSDAHTTNGGHVCLLARADNLSPPSDTINCTTQHYGATPSTDPLQGIRNIHVDAAPPSPPPKGGGGGGGGNRDKFMSFAFAATNTLRNLEDTKLNVRVLEPGKHRAELELLAADPVVDRVLSRRQLKFAVPNGLLVGAGRERVVVPNFQALGREAKEGTAHPCVPRLSKLGPITEARLPYLLAPGEKPHEVKKAIDLKLLPGELRQTVVQVERSGKHNTAYAVDVSHEGADGRVIGGLVILFVPPYDAF